MSVLAIPSNTKQPKRPSTPSQKILPSYSSKANNFFPEDFFGNSSTPKQSLNRPLSRCAQTKECYFTKPKIRPMLTKKDFTEESIKNTSMNPFTNQHPQSKLDLNNQISYENDIDPSTSGSYNNGTLHDQLLYQTPHFFPKANSKDKEINSKCAKDNKVNTKQSHPKVINVPKPKVNSKGGNVPERPQTQTPHSKPVLKKINTNLIQTTRAKSSTRMTRGIQKDVSHQVVNKELSQLMENIPSYLIEDPEVKKGFDMLFKNIDDIKKVIDKKSIEKTNRPSQKSTHIIKENNHVELKNNNFRKETAGRPIIKHKSTYSMNQLCKNKSSNVL